MTTQVKPKATKQHRGVYLNLDERTKGRVEKRAEASSLKLGPYCVLATRHYLDLEDAFGGTLPDNLRAELVRVVGKYGQTMPKLKL